MICDKCKQDKDVVIGAYSKGKGFKQYCSDCFRFREEPNVVEQNILNNAFEVNSVANRDEQVNEI